MIPTRNRLSILVVDDNSDAADSTAELLDCLGHSARAVYSGTEAERLMSEYNPDVVFLDLLMEDMDGWELARRLRPTLSSQQYLVAITGCQGDVDRQRSAEAGIDLHLIKPVSSMTLQLVLERFVKDVVGVAKN